MARGQYKEIYFGSLSDEERMLYRMAGMESSLSRCKRHQIGAASINWDGTIGRGYNSGCDGHCVHEGLPKGTNTDCKGSHAERDLLARYPRPMTLVVTTFPCMNCAKALAEAGVFAVLYRDNYGDNKALDYLLGQGVRVTRILLREEGSTEIEPSQSNQPEHQE